MRGSSLLLRLAGLSLAAGAIFGGAACSLIAGLDQLEFKDAGADGGTGGSGGSGGSGGGATCSPACDDGDACTKNDCLTSAGCQGTPIADGLPAGTDTKGDCQKTTCQGGMPVTGNDDGDPPDDNEDCTVDACSMGHATHLPKSDTTPCTVGGAAGTCFSGQCAVSCGPTAPCDDQNPCTTDTCNATGLCTFTALMDGTATPGVNEPAGDCKVHRCVGGKDTDLIDDKDVPASNECADGACVSGVPTPKFDPAGKACSMNGGKHCDGAGQCVVCVADDQCPGPVDDCQHPSCSAMHTCGTALTADGTKVSNQTAGDCKVIECDGAGKAKVVTDDTDLPAAKTCQVPKCSQGAPSYSPAASGTACGNGLTCNGAGSCVCTSNAQCTAPDTCGGGGTMGACGCTPKTCAQLGATCGSHSDGCFATLNCNDSVKNGGETDVDCGGASCAVKCSNGKTCAAGSDCSSGLCADGVCCNTACNGTCQACNLPGTVGLCTNVPLGGGDVNGMVICTMATACDGTGNCKQAAGQPCMIGSDCASGVCSVNVCQ